MGTAGVAQVHLGLRLSPVGIERLVTIKWLHEGLSRHRDLVASFLREAQVAGELTHTNIVRVLDVGKHGGAYFMAMEYVDQEPLTSVLKELRTQGMPSRSPEEAVHIAAVLCGALHYAHTKRTLDGAPLGIIHGAISPDNVFISVAGDIKLGEFGASGPLRSGRLASRTPYMAPEHVRGEPLDRRADVFSVGVILSELLTGHPQFRVTTLPDVSSPSPGPSQRDGECPPELEAIVLRAVAPDKEARYRSAGEMQMDLERFAKSRGYSGSMTALASLVGRIFRDREANYQKQLREAKAIARSVIEERRPRADASRPPPLSPPSEPRLEVPIAVTPRLEVPIAVTPRLEAVATGERAPAVPTTPAPPPMAHTVAPPPELGTRRLGPASAGLLAVLVALVGVGIGWRLPHPAASTEPPPPPEPRPASLREGKLVVESEPNGASVWLEGALAATTTPATVDHLPLDQRLKVRIAAPGFDPSEVHVILSPERPDDHLLVTLKKATLLLRLQIDAPNSAVWIDGRYRGERLVRGLSVGEDHKVAVSAPGRIGKVIYVHAEQGGERFLEFKLEPAIRIPR
jgi:eukaryotic-like serine/threonine-protein kinase